MSGDGDSFVSFQSGGEHPDLTVPAVLFIVFSASAKLAAAQRSAQSICAFPPYYLESPDIDELSWWVKAVRWFDTVTELSGLPAPVQVARALERRRAPERLAQTNGKTYLGRSAEMKTLPDRFEVRTERVAVLTGVGGMGQSALAAKFAFVLDAKCSLVWLDCERGALAAGDAPR